MVAIAGADGRVSCGVTDCTLRQVLEYSPQSTLADSARRCRTLGTSRPLRAPVGRTPCGSHLQTSAFKRTSQARFLWRRRRNRRGCGSSRGVRPPYACNLAMNFCRSTTKRMCSEREFAALDGCQYGCGSDGLSRCGGPEVRGADLSPHGSLPFRQGVFHSLHGRIFHQGHHGGSGQYFQVAAAHVGGQMLVFHCERAGVRQS